MKICYHGTNEEAAKSILKEGFRAGTWFAANLQDALEFGGNYVFKVVFDFEKAPHWQFLTSIRISPDMITNCTVYQKQEIFNNEELRKKVFESNF